MASAGLARAARARARAPTGAASRATGARRARRRGARPGRAACTGAAPLDLETALAVFDAREGKKVWFTAEKGGSTSVVEQPGWRPLADYMALPVSQYSVLDGATIDRLSEDTFELSMEALEFFKFKLKPILTAQVVTNAKGCSIQVLDVTLQGPKLIEAANGTFFIDSSNEVSWRQAETGKEITSQAHVRVGVVVPRWNVLPLGLITRTGSALMAATLNVVVPRFLKQLAKDYEAWGAGDDSRAAQSTGEGVSDEPITVKN